MKVLIVIDSFGAGGAEKSTLEFSDFLEKQNISFELVCIDNRKTGFQDIINDRGFNISFFESKNFFFQVYQLANIIRNGKFDIVNSVLFRSSLRVRFAKLFVKFVHIESIVSTRYSKEKRKQTTNLLGFYIYYFLDFLTSNLLTNHFHSISETVKAHFHVNLKIPLNKITVVYRGRNYPERLKIWGHFNPQLELITIGRQELVKGQIYLFKAMKTLVDNGYNVNLKLLGREGNASLELNKFILDNNLQKNISIQGFKLDVYQDLIQSDLFVFPSTFEGLGGALIEAQSVGLPIACSDIEIFREVVNRNVNARFFDNMNPSSIAEAIIYFYENRDLLKSYGNQSLKNFNLKFSSDQNNFLLLNLFKEKSLKNN